MPNKWSHVLRYLATFGIVSLATGCATPAQNQAISDHQTLKLAFQDFDSCKAPIYSDAKYAPLGAHIPLGSFLKDVTLEQMESMQYPTASEIALISNLEDRLAPCRQTLVEAVDSVSSDIGTPFQTFFNTEDQAILNLSQGHTTWGQFVAALHTAAINEQQSAVAAAGARDQQLNAENAAEVAQRAQALQTYSVILQQQQQNNQQVLEQQQENIERQQEINSLNRPVNTTCNQFGTQTNCTSY